MIRFAGFTDPWEQRKFGDCFEFLKSNTLSRAGLNGENGTARNVHYGDILIKFGDCLDGERSDLPFITDDTVLPKFAGSILREGDVIFADTAEDEAAGKCVELRKLPKEPTISGLHTIPARPRFFFGTGYLGHYLNSDAYHRQLLPSIYSSKEPRVVINTINEEMSFCDYYSQWVDVYKEGAIREVTMKKYKLTQAWLRKLIPDLKLSEFDRVSYQKLINGYAEHHEHQTTMDFHHQLKGAILDAVDEGLIQRDPTRKAIIKGKQPRQKKVKYLNQFELHAVLADLKLDPIPNWDWLILLVAKTGLRFSEALGLTPDDFDFVHQTLSVNKTWNYKNGGGFVPTKNASSVRKVQLDWQLTMQLSVLLKSLPGDKPIFVDGKVYNSTANGILARHCKQAGVPVISIHGLRHTHASLLLFAGVSIASVSKRLGHASMNTTQEIYLHVIRELENKDVDIVMRALSTLI